MANIENIQDVKEKMYGILNKDYAASVQVEAAKAIALLMIAEALSNKDNKE